MGKTRPEAPSSAPTPDEPVGRRALLRRAATVAAAGIGGIAATEMLSAGPAGAAIGDPLTLGSVSNDAQGNQTKMTSSTAAGASIEVANSGLTANVRLAPVAAAAPYGATTNPTGDPGGALAGGELINLTEASTDGQGNPVDVDTLYWMTGTNVDRKFENLTVVLTTATGTVFAPVAPVRLLDTRSTAGRTRLASRAVLDSQGRLIGGKALELQVDDLVIFAYSMHFNLTATGETGTGFLTVWPGGTQPKVSNLNYQAGVSIANSGLSPLSSGMSIFIYASKTTHVLLDLQGWTLPDFSFLVGNTPANAAKVAGAAAARPSVLPGPVPSRHKKTK